MAGRKIKDFTARPCNQGGISVEKKYTSNIKNMPFLFLEMKRTAVFLVDGKTKEEILALSTEQNVYQLEKEQRRRELPLKMLARLSTLNNELVKVVAVGNEYEAKLVSFFAMMKTDRLLFEYMLEVYADRHRVGVLEINDRDYEEFIDRKIQNSETVAKWKTNNLVKVRTAIKSTLVNAGLAKRSGSNLEVLPPIVDKNFINMFDYQDGIYIKAMLLPS